MTSQGKHEKSRAWLDRTDPRAKMLTELPNQEVEEGARSERLKELALRAVLDEYADAGINPVYADPERTMLVSLSMLLAGGWRIEQMMGRNVLTRATGQMQEAE